MCPSCCLLQVLLAQPEVQLNQEAQPTGRAEAMLSLEEGAQARAARDFWLCCFQPNTGSIGIAPLSPGSTMCCAQPCAAHTALVARRFPSAPSPSFRGRYLGRGASLHQPPPPPQPPLTFTSGSSLLENCSYKKF